YPPPTDPPEDPRDKSPRDPLPPWHPHPEGGLPAGPRYLRRPAEHPQGPRPLPAHPPGGQAARRLHREIGASARPAPAPGLPPRRADQRLSLLNRHQCIPGDATGGGRGQGTRGADLAREEALLAARARRVRG